MTITLTNDYHHTTVTLRPDSQGRLTNGQIRKAQKTLCGVAGCSCGDSFGMRGEQPGTAGLAIEILYHAPGYAARVF